MGTRLGLIHALAHSMAPINEALARAWPEAQRMNLLDDTLAADLAASGGELCSGMHARFSVLARYAADAGCRGLLFTCSAFGPCIDAVKREHPGLTVLKPGEAMIDEAVAADARIGLVASFAPTLRSMPSEFPVPVDVEWAEGALEALHGGDSALHDIRIAEAAGRVAGRGVGIIVLAQFSMARAVPLVRRRTGLPVLSTIDSSVRELTRRLRGNGRRTR